MTPLMELVILWFSAILVAILAMGKQKKPIPEMRIKLGYRQSINGRQRLIISNLPTYDNPLLFRGPDGSRNRKSKMKTIKR